jgi:hypothetical protein
MKTAATEMIGIKAPILAFSRCRDVAASSKAGPFGLGDAPAPLTQLLPSHRARWSENRCWQVDQHRT